MKKLWTKKCWMLMLLLTLSALVLAGCAGNADTLPSPTAGVTDSMPQSSPGATNGVNDLLPGASMAPDASAAPVGGGDAAAGIASLDEARRASEEMEAAVEKLSEVEEACVVAVGNTALVGLRFNSQYQGGLDDRMKGMVLTRVQTIHKGVTQAAVTDEAAQVGKIEALADTLDEATSLSALSAQAEELSGQVGLYSK